MKTTRWALLVLLVFAISAVIAGYYVTRNRNQMMAPAKPSPLPAGLDSIANNWSYSQSSRDRPVVEARARDFRQIKGTSRVELGEVELKIFTKGDTYDLVRSKKAEFDQLDEKLYSEGEVTIVLGLPAAGPPPPGKRYVEIRTSGLTYDNKSGVSSTDQPVHFQFENGEGHSVGAVYDAVKRYLWMKSEAEIIGAGGRAGMHLRAGELYYWEAEQKIDLRPWSRLERSNQGVDAAASTVYLDQGDLKRVEAQQGKGWNNSPGRQVRFSGAALDVNFTPEGAVATATGTGEAQVTSESPRGVTRVSGGRIDLEFSTPAGAEESELSAALVTGHGRVESAPAVSQDRPQPETKILTAEAVKVVMMPGGENVKTLETLSAGRLELIPNQLSQWRRTLTAERLSIQYLPGNRPEALRAGGKVHLRSEPPGPASAGPSGGPRAPRNTWSDDLQASFDAQTGQMRELRQWSNFHYEEGARKAEAGEAQFDLPNDRVTLNTAARVWDENSRTAADRLVLDQKQDRFRAEGDVSSTSQERVKPSESGAQREALFASDRPVHATARRLDSEQRNRLLHYRGGARLWQEGNSVQADEIDLDRTGETLEARGGVVSVLVEEESSAPTGQPAKSGRPASQRLVSISSESLVYTDQNRRALYRGRVVMRREHMTIRAAELEAFLRPPPKPDEGQSGKSRLERALARGKVEILEAAASQHAPRRAYAEQAEYLCGEEKVTLRGGMPTLEQPGRGFTRGSELTYYINDDRLLVSGQQGIRSETHQKLKRN